MLRHRRAGARSRVRWMRRALSREEEADAASSLASGPRARVRPRLGRRGLARPWPVHRPGGCATARVGEPPAVPGQHSGGPVPRRRGVLDGPRWSEGVPAHVGGGPLDEALPGRSHGGWVRVPGPSRAARRLPRRRPGCSHLTGTRRSRRRGSCSDRGRRAESLLSIRRRDERAGRAGALAAHATTGRRAAEDGPSRGGGAPAGPRGRSHERRAARCRSAPRGAAGPAGAAAAAEHRRAGQRSSVATRGDRGTAPPSDARDRSGPGGVAGRSGRGPSSSA